MKYALIIGNNKYDDPKLAQLKTPAADSQALAKVLEDTSIGAFDKVFPVINQSETRTRRAVSAFLLNKKPEDLVLVYFSGHGILDDRGRLFLALRDTQVNLLKATAIPSSFITDEMDSCRSRRQILILDCCHSGAYARGTKGEQKAITEATFEGSGYGRVVMTASDSTQYALEGDQVISQTDLSLFTHFLLEGLKTGEADINNDGHVSLDEWYDYAYAKVILETLKQTPHKWSYNQQGDLIIARNPHVKKRVIELPFELVQAIESPFTTIRENATIELGKLLHSRDSKMVNLAHLSLEKMKDDDSRKISSIAESLILEFTKMRPPINESAEEHKIEQLITPVAVSKKKTDWREKMSGFFHGIKHINKTVVGLIGLLVILVLGYLLFQVLFNSYSKFPIQLYVNMGTVSIYRDPELKTLMTNLRPDETTYYPCIFDLNSNSYLIATSPENCRTKNAFGWVRARVVKKLFIGDFPYTQP